MLLLALVLSLALSAGAFGASKRAAGASPVLGTPTGLTSTSVTLHASYGFTGNTFAHYQYGLTTAYGTNVVASGPVSSGTDDPVLITGLTPCTTYHYRYIQGAVPPGTGNPSTDGTFTTTGCASSGAPNQVDESVDMTLTSTALPASVRVGDQLTITYTATNRAGVRASNVTVGEALPSGVALVSATPSQGSCTGTYSCSLGFLSQGQSATVKVVLTVNVAGGIVLNPSVGTTNPDPVTGNNYARAAVIVGAKISTRTLTITSTTRIPGPGFGGQDSKIRVVGTLAASEPLCAGNTSVSVFRSATPGGPSDLTQGVGGFTTKADGTFDIQLEDLPGMFWTFSVAPTEQAAYACTAANASATVAPRLVSRSVSGESERDSQTKSVVHVTGKVTADSSWCSSTVSLRITTSAGSVTAKTDAKGVFKADLNDPSVSSSKFQYTVTLAEEFVRANQCLAATGLIEAPASPVERRLKAVVVPRTPSGNPDAGFSVTGVVGSNFRACLGKAKVTLSQRVPGADDFKDIASGETSSEGNVTLKSPDDSGDFVLELEPNITGGLACSRAAAGFRVPARIMQRSVIGVLADRRPVDSAFVTVTGVVASAGATAARVSECVPSRVSLESRPAGSKGGWTFESDVRNADPTGRFAGQLRIDNSAGREYRISAAEQKEGRYSCLAASAPVTIPVQQVGRDIRFGLSVQRGGVDNSAQVRVIGSITSAAAQCVGNVDLVVDGYPGGRRTVTTGGVRFLSGGGYVADFDTDGLITGLDPKAPFPDDAAKLMQVGVGKTTVGGVECAYDVQEQPRITVPTIVNTTGNTKLPGGSVQLTAKIESLGGSCRSGVPVAIQRTDAPGSPNETWVDVATATPDADGSISTQFEEPGSAYKAAWRLVSAGQKTAVGDCSPAIMRFDMPRPVFVKAPPAHGIDSELQVGVTHDATKAAIDIVVVTNPDTEAARRTCTYGQKLRVNVFSSVDSIGQQFDTVIGQDGRARVIVDRQAHVTDVSIWLYSKNLVSPENSGLAMGCNDVDHATAQVLGLITPSNPVPVKLSTSAGDLEFRSQLQVGYRVRFKLQTDDPMCTTTPVQLVDAAGKVIATTRATANGQGEFFGRDVPPANASWSVKLPRASFGAKDQLVCQAAEFGLQWGTPLPAPPLPPKAVQASVQVEYLTGAKAQTGVRAAVSQARITVRIEGGPADAYCFAGAQIGYTQAYQQPFLGKPRVIADRHDNVAEANGSISPSFVVPLLEVPSLIGIHLSFPERYASCLVPKGNLGVALKIADDGLLDPDKWEFKTFNLAKSKVPAFEKAVSCKYGPRIDPLSRPRDGYVISCSSFLSVAFDATVEFAVGELADEYLGPLAGPFAANLIMAAYDYGTNPDPNATFTSSIQDRFDPDNFQGGVTPVTR